MRHASLFTGIGGFDLAAEWLGWQNIFQCEIDPWCQKLLKQNFPTVQHRYGNIKETDFKQWAGRIDILSGGFPCQPYSTAGKRLGKNDDRHLWPEMLRVIREVSPRWIVGENVRGLTNWNGGVVFDEVQADLEAEGYEVLPFLLPACAVNAPHRRDRVWFIAHSTRKRCGETGEYFLRSSERIARFSSEWNASNAERIRCEGDILTREGIQWAEQARQKTWASGYKDGVAPYSDSDQRPERGLYADGPGAATIYTSLCGAWASGRAWEDFPTQSPVCGRDDGVSHRVDRLKGLGNAVVPQVVLQIFKAIEQYELLRIPA
ncbi:DNA cytosine methyltransferase [Chitinophaga sp. GCM10012297]|uniref:Cytosine-specific methyltransferase n=1 Tax=Chitinophaga chungangae TaxID=2821488 RepID=A0ABS3YCR2_9BACT|nr:DNA cytosine methyltransferase [Chitinophaga chungangae]MBO9151899.1 DNA cytosine methyltransferase [Chitinophaga chungangae]